MLHRAIDLGLNFIDTTDHNNGNNEGVRQSAQGKRDAVVLTSKFAISAGQPGPKVVKSMAGPSTYPPHA